jgi:hypothetical protein
VILRNFFALLGDVAPSRKFTSVGGQNNATITNDIPTGRGRIRIFCPSDDANLYGLFAVPNILKLFDARRDFAISKIDVGCGQAQGIESEPESSSNELPLVRADRFGNHSVKVARTELHGDFRPKLLNGDCGTPFLVGHPDMEVDRFKLKIPLGLLFPFANIDLDAPTFRCSRRRYAKPMTELE